MLPITTIPAEQTPAGAPGVPAQPGETHLATDVSAERFTDALASMTEADRESSESAIELPVPEGEADESAPTGPFEDVEVRVEVRDGINVTVDVDGELFAAEPEVTRAETPAATEPDADEGAAAEVPRPLVGRATEPDLDESALARRALAETPSAQGGIKIDFTGGSGDATVEVRPVPEASAPQVGPPASDDLPSAETPPTILGEPELGHSEPELGHREPDHGLTRPEANTGRAAEGEARATRASATVPDQVTPREILAGHAPPVDQRPAPEVTPAEAEGPQALSEASSSPTEGLPRSLSAGPVAEDAPPREATLAALRASIAQLESQRGPEPTPVRGAYAPQPSEVPTTPVQLAQILKGVLLDQSLAPTGPRAAARLSSKGQMTPPPLLGVEPAVDGEAAPLPVFGAQFTGDGKASWQSQLRGEAIFEPRSVHVDVARYEQITRLTDALTASGWAPAPGGAASTMRAAVASAIPLSNLEAHELPEQLVRVVGREGETAPHGETAGAQLHGDGTPQVPQRAEGLACDRLKRGSGVGGCHGLPEERAKRMPRR